MGIALNLKGIVKSDRDGLELNQKVMRKGLTAQIFLCIFYKTMRRQSRQCLRLLSFMCFAVFLLIILAGCVTKDTLRSENDEERLRQRATAYWNYRMTEQSEYSYEMEYPLLKKEMGLGKYARSVFNPMMRVRDYQVSAVTFEPSDKAVVEGTAKLELRPPGDKPLVIDRTVSDTWVRIDGEWYHVFGSTSSLTHEQDRKGGDGEELK